MYPGFAVALVAAYFLLEDEMQCLSWVLGRGNSLMQFRAVRRI